MRSWILTGYVPRLLEIGSGWHLDAMATALHDSSGLGTAIEEGDDGRGRWYGADRRGASGVAG